MAKLVKRFFGKKRGEHNMRSDVVGGAWWAMFSALFLLAGCLMLANLLSQVMIPEWRANNHFRASTCRVLDKQLQQRDTEEGDHVYRPNIHIAYEVAGTRHEQWTYDAARMFTSSRDHGQAILDQFQVGRDYACWYDPADPEQVVLTRGYSWHAWLFLVLPVPFIAIGGGGLVYAWLNWGKSTEQRAVLSQRSAQPGWDQESEAMRRQFPYVPAVDDLINSSGTKLAYRLPNRPSGWSVFGLSLVTLVWLAVTSVLVTMAVQGFRAGQPEWFLTPFAAVCSLAGLALVVTTVRRFMVDTGVESTLVEIDRHPLYPGERSELYISQSGRLNLNLLRIVLVCEEESHYRQGTNLRTERRRVYEAELLRHERFEITSDRPFEARVALDIPNTAMHSFEGEHNKVQWRLVVEGDLSRWPNFLRSYNLVVYPPRHPEPAL